MGPILRFTLLLAVFFALPDGIAYAVSCRAYCLSGTADSLGAFHLQSADVVESSGESKEAAFSSLKSQCGSILARHYGWADVRVSGQEIEGVAAFEFTEASKDNACR